MVNPRLIVKATARIEPITDAAPLIAQAQLTSLGSVAPAIATTLGKTAPSGTPSATDAITATAARASNGQARVIAATQGSKTRTIGTAIAQSADALSGSVGSREEQTDPNAAPMRSAARPRDKASAG